jgi:hypothetical protein
MHNSLHQTESFNNFKATIVNKIEKKKTTGQLGIQVAPVGTDC